MSPGGRCDLVGVKLEKVPEMFSMPVYLSFLQLAMQKDLQLAVQKNLQLALHSSNSPNLLKAYKFQKVTEQSY